MQDDTATHLPTGPVEALLFDLGGVVIDIDFDRVFQAWAALATRPLEQIRAQFDFGEVYCRYERGEVSDADYFAHVRDLLAIEASDEAIRTGWNAVFVGQNRTVLDLIRGIGGDLPTYAFTNTSPCHQVAWSSAYPDVVKAFRRIFSSAEMGLRKPEREAFDTVVAAIGAAPQRILFFDDMPANVAGARAAGLQAVQVRSPQDVSRALAALAAT